MPLYVNICAGGHVTEDFRSVERRHETISCETCGEPTKLTPATFAGQVVGGTPKHYPDRI